MATPVSTTRARRARLAQQRIPLTVCPLSNLKLQLVPSMAAHPLRRSCMDAGLCVTVNSDDPSYFGGYVNDNYLACQAGARPRARQEHGEPGAQQLQGGLHTPAAAARRRAGRHRCIGAPRRAWSTRRHGGDDHRRLAALSVVRAARSAPRRALFVAPPITGIALLERLGAPAGRGRPHGARLTAAGELLMRHTRIDLSSTAAIRIEAQGPRKGPFASASSRPSSRGTRASCAASTTAIPASPTRSKWRRPRSSSNWSAATNSTWP